MSDMPERIWAFDYDLQDDDGTWKNWQCWCEDSPAPLKATEYIRADLALAAPKVKALVWQEAGDECIGAETVLGRYEVMWGFDSGQAVLDVPRTIGRYKWHETPEAAKAAAQADYEARILAALEGGDA